MGLTVKELIPIGERILKEAGVENAKHDAEALIGFAIGLDRQKLFLNQACEVDAPGSACCFDLINRRAAGEPLQYITGEQYFMGFRFLVNPSVLIPRPETELLAERASSHLQAHTNATRVLDLCTGSGAIAISIAKILPLIKVTASDISEQALGTARKNAFELSVSDRIDFIKSDLFCSIEREACEKEYDLIVTNPPYIKTDELADLQREIKEHEPLSALDGGADGLDFYRRIAFDARSYLHKNGCLLAEIGAAQTQDVSEIFLSNGFSSVEVFQDLSGRDRIVRVV